MSQQEGPNREDVRRALLGFARLVQRLDDEGKLLRALPYLVGRLGDLRHLLFEYEVRFTERLLPLEDSQERESRRIVREAKERELEAPDEWSVGWTPEEDDPDDDAEAADGDGEPDGEEGDGPSGGGPR